MLTTFALPGDSVGINGMQTFVTEGLVRCKYYAKNTVSWNSHTETGKHSDFKKSDVNIAHNQHLMW